MTAEILAISAGNPKSEIPRRLQPICAPEMLEYLLTRKLNLRFVSLMAYDSVALAIVAMLLGFLGLLGGIPQMLRWIKPRPHLKITNATVLKIPNENYKFQLHFEVENERKSWKRSGAASNVTSDYYVVDKDSVQRGGTYDQAVSQYLLAGLKMLKDTDMYLALTPEGNPYRIVFRVMCKEGYSATKIVAFEAQPILYS